MANTVGIPVQPDGEWALKYLSGLTAEDWRQWMDDRLRGRDHRVAYRPDEYPEGASDIFMHAYDLPQNQAGLELADQMSKGIASLVSGLSPETEDYWVLYHAIDLVGYLRAGAAREVMADWIRNERLLQLTRWPENGAEMSVRLHRAALTSLAVLQVRGDKSCKDIWEKWFCLFQREEYTPAFKYAFVPSAFIGLAHMETRVPTRELCQLLKWEQQARSEGITLYVSHAVMALFGGDRPLQASMVRGELASYGWTKEQWQSLREHTQNSPHPLRKWELIQPSGTTQKKTKSEQRDSVWSREPRLVPATG